MKKSHSSSRCLPVHKLSCTTARRSAVVVVVVVAVAAVGFPGQVLQKVVVDGFPVGRRHRHFQFHHHHMKLD